MINTIIMSVFWVVTALHTLTNFFITWKIKRKQTFAVLASKDGDHQLIRINPNKNCFKHDKTEYIIPSTKDYLLKIGSKSYVRYCINNPSPMLWHTDTTPIIPGDVLRSIIESEGLKLLNTPPFAMDFKKVLIIGAVVLVVIFVVMNTGGSAPTPSPT